MVVSNKEVLYLPDICRNLSYVGLTFLSNISFVTLGSLCTLYRNFGIGPKIMEGWKLVHYINYHLSYSTRSYCISSSQHNLATYYKSQSMAFANGYVNVDTMKKIRTSWSLENFLFVHRQISLMFSHIACTEKTTLEYQANVFMLIWVERSPKPSLSGAIYYLLFKDECTLFL